MNDTKDIKVSVVIPTYNRREELKKAIQSVLSQTESSFEILVCDDGSSDGTPEMVNAWPDTRVQLISGPRGGCPAVPRNRGIKHAKGEWIAFLDDDDIWVENKIETQINAANLHGKLVVSSNAYRVRGNSCKLFHLNKVPQELTARHLLSSNYIITSSIIIHNTILKETPYFPEDKQFTAYEDYMLWLYISDKHPILYMDEPLLYYKDVPDCSVRSKAQGTDREIRRKIYKHFIQWIIKNKNISNLIPAFYRYIRTF